ncbi:JmjC domain-containing protein 7 [Blyttiomyces sp. JEL0837]|nr:JmjC domain-containing protein 7 [Blyttiomyces sp. JEL0837]
MDDPITLPGIHGELRRLAREASELGVNRVIYLDSPPTALEFLRLVMENTPAVIRKYAFHESEQWPALQKWTSKSYLKEAMNGQKVTVSITPNGLADAVVDGKFCLPYEEEMEFGEFLDIMERERVKADDQDLVTSGSSAWVNGDKADPVFYCQSQNNNMRQGDFQVLFRDVPLNIDFATEALGLEPDAINFWIGSSRAFTYENLYVVISGTKTFTLVPPTETWALSERKLPTATYKPSNTPVRDDASIKWTVENVTNGENVMVTRWCTVDPRSAEFKDMVTGDDSDEGDEFDSGRREPITVTLQSGDMLYLPSMWGHCVEQGQPDTHDDLGNAGWLTGAIAVNYWMDMSYNQKYALLGFIRKMAGMAGVMDTEDER